MRIGLSCNFIEPALCGGKLDGIGTFTQGLYRELQIAGQSVVPVVFPSFKNRSPHCQLPETQVLPQPYPLSLGLSVFLGMETPGAKKLQEKIDLYHCTDYLIPRLTEVPVVAMIHDAVKVQHPDWNSGRLRRLKTFGLQKAVRWADHYITPSQAVVSELVEYFGLDEKNITVIHNALSDFWLEPVSEEQKNKVLNHYQLQPGFLLFTGTFQPRKNLRRILDAFKTLPPSIQKEHTLVLVGQQGWIDETLLQEILRLSQSGQLRWLHYISQEELRALYHSAALFLFPSLHEGFGLPILEAFASGTPVITSNIAAMPEVAGDAAHLVDPYQTDEIRGAILQLLQNCSQRETLIEKGSRRAREFSWEKCKQAVLQVYRKFNS